MISSWSVLGRPLQALHGTNEPNFNSPQWIQTAVVITIPFAYQTTNGFTTHWTGAPQLHQILANPACVAKQKATSTVTLPLRGSHDCHCAQWAVPSRHRNQGNWRDIHHQSADGSLRCQCERSQGSVQQAQSSPLGYPVSRQCSVELEVIDQPQVWSCLCWPIEKCGRRMKSERLGSQLHSKRVWLRCHVRVLACSLSANGKSVRYRLRTLWICPVYRVRFALQTFSVSKTTCQTP